MPLTAQLSNLMLRTFALLRVVTVYVSILLAWICSCALSISAANAQEQSIKVGVYSEYGRSLLASIATPTEPQLVKRDGAWSLVRFAQPVVPVWISSDYAFVQEDNATITANRLNLRTRPSLQSPILASANRGYQSKILQTVTGFIQILAPTEVAFWVKNSELATVQTTALNKKSKSMTAAPGLGSESSLAPPITSQTRDLDAPGPATTPAQSDDGVRNDDGVPNSDDLTAQQNYLLAPGDTISLRVFGEDDLSISNIRIPQSGQVSFPLIGAFTVSGKTIDALESLLSGVLAQGYVKNPRLSVTVDNYRPIFVLGAAQRIGSFPYSEGLTVAKAIAVAGGGKFSAKPNGVSLLRDGVVVEEGLTMSSQLRVLPGDIISLDEELGVSEESTSYVYLHGEVSSPGEYEFRRGLTVEKAIVLAGGFSLRASRKRISVSRLVDGEERPQKLKKVALHMPVKPGDIIDVGARWF